jgi:hypothetical protein
MSEYAFQHFIGFFVILSMFHIEIPHFQCKPQDIKHNADCQHWFVYMDGLFLQGTMLPSLYQESLQIDSIFTYILLQTICHEVESKREEMKRLVQILDGLLVYANESQALQEQTQLETLISRYRLLVPSIETTITRSDVWSRAYNFKTESEEVSRVEDISIHYLPLTFACLHKCNILFIGSAVVPSLKQS